MSFDPWTRDEFLDLWRTLFPRGFTEPIENEAHGFGLDPYAMQAAIFARVSEALSISTQAYYLRDASSKVADYARGEARATGTLEIRRATGSAAGDVTIVSGTRFVADVITPTGRILDGELFELTSDVTLVAGSLGPVSATIRAVRPGWQGNVPEGTINRFALRGTAEIPSPIVEAGNTIRDSGLPDRWTLGMVGQYVRLVGGANGGGPPRRIVSVTPGTPTSIAVLDGAALVTPDTLTSADVLEYSELGLEVSQPAATSGGRHGFLDAIARDRGTARALGETDEELRDRLVNLADVVSPAAIQRIATRILSPLGIAFEILETRDPLGLRGFVLDVDPLDHGDICGNGQVILDAQSATRFFVICVSPSALGETGSGYDMPVPPVVDPPPALDLALMDGYPVTYYGALASLWAAVEAARAAGISWRLVRDAGA